MIAAFPGSPSVRAGETLRLYVCADRPCTVRFVRAGKLVRTMDEYRHAPILASQATPGEAGKPRNWPVYTFEIPPHWRSGVYSAIFETRMAERKFDAREARALFIVLPPSPQSPILYNVPIFTYHAYNTAHDTTSENTCLYNGAKAVTLARPGGGNGGHTWNEGIIDVYDPATPRQTFAHWDQVAIRWLESTFGSVDYACDLDLHCDPGLLNGYRLLLGFGHHEYWTDAMRDALRRHMRGGRNAAFFCGNTCWFRIRYDEATQSISRIGRWIEDPEERTFGLSYKYGAGKWRAGRPPTGFTADQRHWVFDGTGLRTGEIFGDEERLIGYECDGAPDHDASPHFELLAHSRVDHWSVVDGSGEINGGRAGLGITHDKGALFAAGTVDWARVLDAGEPTVDRITQNVIRRFANL